MVINQEMHQQKLICHASVKRLLAQRRKKCGKAFLTLLDKKVRKIVNDSAWAATHMHNRSHIIVKVCDL